MKKCLSLIAILGLIASTSFAAAPNFPEVPSVKIAIGQGLTPAFDLAAYNTGDAATTASVVTNPANLSTLSTTFDGGVITVANVNYGTYSLGSAFSFTYRFTNEGGSANAANKAKYSNNRMKKLPVIGLNVGSSADIVVGNYVVGTYPVSFGNTGALAFDTTKVSATWQNNSTVRVTLLAAISAPVKVGVIASQAATQFYGDVDKEEITVAQNLLTGYTFDTNEVASAFGYEQDIYTVKATETYDSAEKALKLALVANSGVKMTQSLSNWVNVQQGNWYIARARVKASAPSTQTKLFVYNGNPGVDPTIDLMANIPLSTSSTGYEWVEAPFYVYSNYTIKNAFLQIHVEGSSGSWWLDELQLIKATPNLMNTRAISNLKVAAGTFSTSSLAGWGAVESYDGAVGYQVPANSIVSGKYTVDFAGAGAGTAAKGLKLTFASAPGVPQAFASDGNEIGMSMNVTKVSGAFSNLDSVILMAMLGYKGANLNQVSAMAQLGALTFGDYYLASDGRSDTYNSQFMTKNGAAGVQTIDNVDMVKDLDGYVFGDANLF